MTARRALHVAVFVKTPGLSPVKSRLAAGVGETVALAFYRQACAAVAATLRLAAERTSPAVVPYWAVAEAAGAASWTGFPVIPQGDGGLGERLATVYAALSGPGRAAVVIGADAPQLGAAELALTAAALAEGADYVVGPAADGGFYLFAGSRPVPRALWTAVTYSQATTAADLVRLLQALGRIAWLPVLTDVDEADDLGVLARELAACAAPTQEQERLRLWLEAGARE